MRFGIRDTSATSATAPPLAATAQKLAARAPALGRVTVSDSLSDRPDRDLPPFSVVPVCLERDEPSALFQNFGRFERALPIIPEGTGAVAINIARANGGLGPGVLQPVEQP